jgi:glucose-1-phosphate cytidylyltransferase
VRARRLLGLLPALRRGTFMLSRGDCLSDVRPQELLDFHRRHGRLGTVVVVRPMLPGRLYLVGDEVVDFADTALAGGGWNSAGLFVLEPDVFDYFDAESPEWERDLIERLADAGELMAYKHESFWQGLETLQISNLS